MDTENNLNDIARVTIVWWDRGPRAGSAHLKSTLTLLPHLLQVYPIGQKAGAKQCVLALRRRQPVEADHVEQLVERGDIVFFDVVVLVAHGQPARDAAQVQRGSASFGECRVAFWDARCQVTDLTEVAGAA